MAPRTKRRKIGTTIKFKGPAWASDSVVVEERYSRTPGTGTYDTVTRKGNVYQRWRGYVENAKGVKVRQSVYDKTEAGLKRKVKALLASPAPTDTKKFTIEDFLTHRFLPGIKQRVRHNTYSTYKTAVTQYIVPDIGKVKFSALTPSNVAAWLDDLDIGARSKQLAFATLRRAYSYAVELGLLDRSPLAGMKGPRLPRTEPRILSLKEANKLLAIARNSEWYPLLYLALVTAMRQGELFGLTWGSVNLTERYIRVTQGLARTENGYALSEPKTATSRRRVDLPKEAVALLREHHRKQIENDLGLVFATPAGKPLDGPNFLKRAFRPLLKEAKLPAVTFHSLRHSGNSLLATSGVPLKVLQGRLGHATSKTTFDVYSHAAPSDGKAAAARIGSLLKGTPRGTTASKAAQSRKPKTKKKVI
jgi:integrase